MGHNKSEHINSGNSGKPYGFQKKLKSLEHRLEEQFRTLWATFHPN